MPLKTQQDELPQLNLTSMIDVVFLLIVFFMVAAKFGDDQRDIDLRLPEVGRMAAATATPKARVVSVHADGHAELDGKPVTATELTTELAAAKQREPSMSVVIRGDAACPFQPIAAAMAACKDAGVTELSVSVKVAAATGNARR